MDRTESGALQRPAALTTHRLIALDTSVLVYFLEGHPLVGGAAEWVLRAVQDGPAEALLSSVALMELLVRPLADGRPDVADEHEASLRRVPHLRVVPFNGDAHRRAADLRAKYGLWPPDALLMGSALAEGATAYVTNDARLRAVDELAVLLLSDFVPKDSVR